MNHDETELTLVRLLGSKALLGLEAEQHNVAFKSPRSHDANKHPFLMLRPRWFLIPSRIIRDSGTQ